MFSCLQILEPFLWFVLITLLNVTLIILTLSVSRLLNLLLRLLAFLHFLNSQILACLSQSITASRSCFLSRMRFATGTALAPAIQAGEISPACTGSPSKVCVMSPPSLASRAELQQRPAVGPGTTVRWCDMWAGTQIETSSEL